MKLTAVNPFDNSQVILTGIVNRNGKEYISFKGAKKNEYFSFDCGLTTIDGQPITSDMFSESRKENNDFSIQTVKKVLLSVNNQWNEQTRYQSACNTLEHLDVRGNQFIESLRSSFFNGNLSEKQAYCLARFIVETNQF